MSAPVARRGAVALLKQGWNEIPEVIGSSAVALVGLGLAGLGLYNYYSKDGDNRRYKMNYVVMRPEDPRAARVRKD